MRPATHLFSPRHVRPHTHTTHPCQVARCICRVAVALSERFLEPLTRGEGDFPKLVSFVFELAGRPERIVMEKASVEGSV